MAVNVILPSVPVELVNVKEGKSNVTISHAITIAFFQLCKLGHSIELFAFLTKHYDKVIA